MMLDDWESMVDHLYKELTISTSYIRFYELTPDKAAGDSLLHRYSGSVGHSNMCRASMEGRRIPMAMVKKI